MPKVSLLRELSGTEVCCVVADDAVTNPKSPLSGYGTFLAEYDPMFAAEPIKPGKQPWKAFKNPAKASSLADAASVIWASKTAEEKEVIQLTPHLCAVHNDRVACSPSLYSMLKVMMCR